MLLHANVIHSQKLETDYHLPNSQPCDPWPKVAEAPKSSEFNEPRYSFVLYPIVQELRFMLQYHCRPWPQSQGVQRQPSRMGHMEVPLARQDGG